MQKVKSIYLSLTAWVSVHTSAALAQVALPSSAQNPIKPLTDKTGSIVNELLTSFTPVLGLLAVIIIFGMMMFKKFDWGYALYVVIGLVGLGIAADVVTYLMSSS
jgi:type IV secretory pathway VirB2 component (pilin)